MGEFRMPSLGADMAAGTLIEWLKQPGDAVKHGDIIAVVETQKGAIEVEVFETGTVDRHLVAVGATVPVGTPLAVISAAGQRPEPAAKRAEPKATRPVAPAAVPLAPKPASRAPSRGEIKASPAARKFAAEQGIALGGIVGSGAEGAITLVDIENALRLGAVPPPAAEIKPAAKGADLAAMRSAIATAMARAKREIPHYYLAHAVDVGLAMQWLGETNRGRPPAQRLVFAALLLKAVALALSKMPEFNGFFREGGFQPGEGVHLGNAIAIRGGGLVAPAIHHADRLALDEIMSKLRDLVGRVRAGRFRSSELSDPTVTLTSLGDRGVDVVYPVIYPPQVAIIGAGTPAPRPWAAADGRIETRPVLQLSLAADHRVSDGHRGALLLAAIAERLQQPERL